MRVSAPGAGELGLARGSGLTGDEDEQLIVRTPPGSLDTSINDTNDLDLLVKDQVGRTPDAVS